MLGDPFPCRATHLSDPHVLFGVGGCCLLDRLGGGGIGHYVELRRWSAERRACAADPELENRFGATKGDSAVTTVVAPGNPPGP